MSFFADIKGDTQSKLKEKALKSRERALNIFEKTIDNGFTPYYSRASHLKAFAAPFYSVAQLARNALRLTYSAFVLLGALASFNGPGTANAFINIGNILLASVIEVLNAACLIISLATRTLASIFNLGYIATQTAPQVPTGQVKHDETRRRAEALEAVNNERQIHDATIALV